ncbi:sensor histidine kinase [Mucilaginibacter sp.]|uniref:sensor histidine kinase n=1 Tax=Mucilaginibacter sp. TaxID=1882438 RepID=UPI003AFFE9DF
MIKNLLKNERELRDLQEEKFVLEQQKKQHELQNAFLTQQELKSQQEKLQFEYAFLRAQINPHFLHNTLNVLYSQALNYSDELAENILKLSHMMRYALESLEHENGKVSIQKELSHLQTLIDINYLRFGNSKAVEYTLEGEMADQMLLPLSIISIVENAFKYGDLKDLENPLQIKIELQPGHIYFFCRNKKRKNNIELTSHHIGITNLSKRLDVFFKDKYEIKAINEDEFYTFELTINN